MTIEEVNARWPDTPEGRDKKSLMLLEMLVREQNETNRLLRAMSHCEQDGHLGREFKRALERLNSSVDDYVVIALNQFDGLRCGDAGRKSLAALMVNFSEGKTQRELPAPPVASQPAKEED